MTHALSSLFQKTHRVPIIGCSWGGGRRVHTWFLSNSANSSYIVVIQSECSRASLIDFNSTIDMNSEKWHSFWILAAEWVWTPTLRFLVTWFKGSSFVYVCSLRSSCVAYDPISTIALCCSLWTVKIWVWCSPWTFKPDMSASPSFGKSKKLASCSITFFNSRHEGRVILPLNPTWEYFRIKWRKS